MSIATENSTPTMPLFGRTVIEAGQTVHLLEENPERPGTWWAWNPTSSRVELVTPPEVLDATETLNPAELTRSLVKAFTSLQERLEASEGLSSSCQKTIAQIREYAIERHQAGDICLQGLRDFLEHFGLDNYPAQVEVNVTVHGTASINASDVESALNRIRFLVDGIEFSGDEEDEDVEFSLGSVEVEPREG